MNIILQHSMKQIWTSSKQYTFGGKSFMLNNEQFYSL